MDSISRRVARWWRWRGVYVPRVEKVTLKFQVVEGFVEVSRAIEDQGEILRGAGGGVALLQTSLRYCR